MSLVCWQQTHTRYFLAMMMIIVEVIMNNDNDLIWTGSIFQHGSETRYRGFRDGRLWEVMLIICINRVTNYFQFDIIPRLQENWIEYTKNSVWVSEPKSYRLFKLSQFCFTNVLCISSTAFQTCSFLDYVVTSPFSLAQNFSPHWCPSHLSESSKVTSINAWWWYR